MYIALRLLFIIHPNLLQRCPRGRPIYILNLKQIVQANTKYKQAKFRFIFSLYTCIFNHKLQMHVLIKLNLGNIKGLLNPFLYQFWLESNKIMTNKKVEGLSHLQGGRNWLKLGM